MSDAEGRAQEALDLADRVFRIENRAPGSGNFWAHSMRGVTLASADRITESEIALRTGLRLVEDQARLGQLPFYHLTLGLTLLHAGRWDDALAECEALLSVPEEAGAAANVFGRAITAYIGLHRGDLGLAARALDEAERDMAGTGLRLGLDFAAFCRAMLLESEGKGDEALALASATWDLVAAVRYGYGTWRTFAPEIVRLSLHIGDQDRAHAVTEEAEEGARRATGIATAEGAALRCRGLLERNPAVLLQAVEAFRLGPNPFECALSCQDAAIALASNSRLSEAVPLFEDAIKTFESVGAARDIARARGELRRFGIRRGSRQARRRPATGWDSLTPTEREAVRLVAEGLPNAEIAKRMYISRYTVETHLKHVYAKLGARSRTELAAQAVRRRGAE
jgi:DNA-binding CsgD family transcriptional regulator